MTPKDDLQFKAFHFSLENLVWGGFEACSTPMRHQLKKLSTDVEGLLEVPLPKI